MLIKEFLAKERLKVNTERKQLGKDYIDGKFESKFKYWNAIAWNKSRHQMIKDISGFINHLINQEKYSDILIVEDEDDWNKF